MQHIREVEVPIPFDKLGWREIGNRLHDMWRLAFDELNSNQSSDQEVYYTLLCTTVRRCQEHMKRIKPDPPDDDNPNSPVFSDPDDTPPPESTGVVVVEKIADMTHRGSGL